MSRLDADEATQREWIGAASAAGTRDTVRMTLDLPKPLHRALKLFGVEHEVRTSAPVIRALLVEMLTDDELAERVLARLR